VETVPGEEVVQQQQAVYGKPRGKRNSINETLRLAPAFLLGYIAQVFFLPIVPDR
jgi:hypothetical protein